MKLFTYLCRSIVTVFRYIFPDPYEKGIFEYMLSFVIKVLMIASLFHVPHFSPLNHAFAGQSTLASACFLPLLATLPPHLL